MRLFKTGLNAGLVRLGQQVLELALQSTGVDELGPRFILNGLQDEVQYLIQTHLGMNNYMALRTVTSQNKNGTQAIPLTIARSWSQIQDFSETALGHAVRALLGYIGDTLDVSVKHLIDQLEIVLASKAKVFNLFIYNRDF